MAEKVTTMVLKVEDLHCPCCYKKVKKLLCKFPQIRNQVFDDKQNTVTITVVCCSPEKIRDKLCCKGGKTIKSILIIGEPKPKPPDKSKPKPPEEPKKKPPEEPKKKPPPEEPKKKPPEEPKKKPPPEEPKKPPRAPTAPPQPTPPPPELICICPPTYPIGTLIPRGVCCGSCYEGRAGGPCYHGYGRPVPCYDGYYGYGGRRTCYISRCDYYLSEENPTGCTIM